MNKYRYCFWLVLIVLLPLAAFGQNGYIPWPAQQDTIIVTPGVNLNTFIFQDTAGTQWQGTAATGYWQNKTRVYILKANATYYWTATTTIAVANRKLMIRGESGKDYRLPSTMSSDYLPKIICVGTTLPAGLILNAANDTLIMKNVAFVAYDAIGAPTNLDNVNTTFVNLNTAGSGSVYLDSIVVSSHLGCVTTNGQGYTVRIQNSIIGDAGTLRNSNLGAGRVFDGRNVELDTLDFSNNTVFNVVDRVVRRLTAAKPIHNFIMNNNTILNCISYHGFVALGWVDSTGAGTFQIKNNLFVDNFVLGPDTDYTRQGEFIDSPDLDANNSLAKMSWFVARRNTTTNIVHWEISNNYYYISDSGKAIRNHVTPLHPVLYNPDVNAEPILTTDLALQLTNNGGNATTAFRKLSALKFSNAPQTPTKFCKWYFNPSAAGYLPTTLAADSAIGAGAGKIKNTAKPVLNFAFLTQFTTMYGQFNRYPYDYRRMRLDSIYDYLSCNFDANWDLSHAASDGGIVGCKRWSLVDLGITTTGVGSSTTQVPKQFTLERNYPNPFNPSTNFTYQLAKAGLVSIKVYDILGREVATLVNEIKQAGSYPVTWDAASFSSGVYFYKMQSGSFSETRKMILMK